MENLIKNLDLKYYANRFRYTEEKLKDMLLGKDGEEKQLLAFVMTNFEEKFIQTVESGVKLKKLDGIDYIDEEFIIEFFHLRKDQLKPTSDKRKLLLDCLKHSPHCYVFNFKPIIAMFQNVKIFESLFAKPIECYSPIKEFCETCDLYNCCKGTEQFRNKDNK